LGYRKLPQIEKNILILTTLLARHSMETLPDTQFRIFQAADALYDESGRAAFPTVDAVRKRAKVNMNDASTGMRAWRRTQMRTADTPSIQIPEKIHASMTAALAALWSEAVALANESLRAAQSGWAIEREESNTVADQMASAFEAQAVELSGAKAENDRLASQLAQQEAAWTALQHEHATMSQAVLVLKADAARAQERAVEAGHRINDLRRELDRSHAVATELRREATAQQLSHETATATWQRDLAAMRDRAQKEYRTMEGALSEAREQNARLQGELAGIEKSSSRRRRTSRNDGESAASAGSTAANIQPKAGNT
jgi:colicin import membrane protein